MQGDVRPLYATPQPVSSHDLYKTGDVDLPPQILDRNGEVVLGLCKRCGRAEVELDESCVPRAATQPSAEVERDAARYRWLREQTWDASELCCVKRPYVAVKLGHECPSHGRLDAAIDEAMKKGGA